MKPLVSVVKTIPRLTAVVSPELTVAGVVVPKMLHGHCNDASGVTTFDGAEAGPEPAELLASTVKVYAVPLVSPVTVAEVAGGVPTTVTGVPAVEPANGVTVYDVTLPPAGAVQLTEAAPGPAVAAVTALGAPGTAPGVTALDGEDAGPVPAVLVAETVNVYVVPLVSPVTVAVVVGTVTGVPGVEPTNGVTVYDVTLPAGAVQLTVADWLPATAVTPVGAAGGRVLVVNTGST
jgi:hypothetical protein